jgi:TRAP-type mannitol/chloroaromatic compound transport system substrate-binding protein
MDRRTFLKSTGAAVATGSAVTAGHSAVAGDERPKGGLNLRTALPVAFTDGYLRDRADRFAMRVQELTDGQVTLTLATDGTCGLEAVRAGRAEAYFGSEAGHLDVHPGLAYVSALPGGCGMAPEHFATWLNAGAGQLHWDAIAADLGVKSFAAGHSGRRVGLWSRQDHATLNAFIAESIHTSGLTALVAADLGMTVTGNLAGRSGPSDYSDQAPDVVEPLAGVAATLSLSPLENARIWYQTGLNPHGTILSFGLSTGVWQRLDSAHRAAIAAAATEAYHQSVAEHDAHDTQVAPVLLAARGISRRTLPDDVVRAAEHVTRQRLAAFVAADTATRRIHESYMQFRENVTGLPDPVSAAAVS